MLVFWALQKDRLLSANKQAILIRRLCYTIQKAYNCLGLDFARVTAPGSDRKKIFLYQQLNIGWRYIRIETQEIPAYVDCHRIVDLVCVLSIFLLNHHMCCDDLAEVIKDEPGKDFLLDILHLFSVEATQTDRIFQFPEGRFDSPSHAVELSELIRRKRIPGKIGNNAFVGIGSERKTHDA